MGSRRGPSSCTRGAGTPDSAENILKQGMNALQHSNPTSGLLNGKLGTTPEGVGWLVRILRVRDKSVSGWR